MSQVHLLADGKVLVFSRNCEDRSGSFPDVGDAIRAAAAGARVRTNGTQDNSPKCNHDLCTFGLLNLSVSLLQQVIPVPTIYSMISQGLADCDLRWSIPSYNATS